MGRSMRRFDFRLAAFALILAFDFAPAGHVSSLLAAQLSAVDDPTEPSDRAAAVDSLLADRSLPPQLTAYALERLLSGHEEDAEPWVYRAADALGRIYVEEGRIAEAATYLELALEGMPDDADLLNTLGYLYADANIQLERAEELVRRALTAAPPETPRHVLGYYRDSLGWAFFRQSNLDSAVVHIELANELAPNTPEIRAHLVDVYDELGRTEDASALLVEDLVAARGVDPMLRARLRRLYRTTPEGRPLPIELEADKQVLAREIAEVAAIEAAGGTVIRLEAFDGFPLVATLYRARGKKTAPAAVLVPMFGGERGDYDLLAHALAQAGISALALDPRGHGASVDREIFGVSVFRDNMPSYIHGAILDVTAAIRYLSGLPEMQDQPLAIIGASLGGFVGALAAVDEGAVQALVLLSPGPAEPYTAAVLRDRHRPILLVAGAADPTAMAGAEAMIAGLDRTRSEVLVYPGDSHGTALLDDVEDLSPRIVRWLGGAFKDARGL